MHTYGSFASRRKATNSRTRTGEMQKKREKVRKETRIREKGKTTRIQVVPRITQANGPKSSLGLPKESRRGHAMESEPQSDQMPDIEVEPRPGIDLNPQRVPPKTAYTDIPAVDFVTAKFATSEGP